MVQKFRRVSDDKIFTVTFAAHWSHIKADDVKRILLSGLVELIKLVAKNILADTMGFDISNCQLSIKMSWRKHHIAPKRDYWLIWFDSEKLAASVAYTWELRMFWYNSQRFVEINYYFT